MLFGVKVSSFVMLRLYAFLSFHVIFSF